MQWVSKANACAEHGIPECLFDDLVAAEILRPVRLGHRTVKFEKKRVEAVALLLPELLAILERVSSQVPPTP